MIKNREGYLVSETERECTNCTRVFRRTSKTVTLCNRCNSNRVKSTAPEAKMLQRAKNRAKKSGVDVTITTDHIIIPEFCPIMGMKLVEGKGRSGGNIDSPALDRINPDLGYIPGNVRVISHLANMMKSCATPNQLLTFSRWVMNNIREDSSQN